MTGRQNVYWDRWEAAGIACVDFEPARRLSFRAIRFLRRYLREEAPDVVYLFNNKAISCCAFAAIGLPPVLVAYRGQTGNIFWYDPSCYLTVLHPRIDAVSCVAHAVRDDLRKHVRRPERVVTLYKGHDPEWYREAPVERSALGVADDAFLLGCTANNRPRKGIPLLVEAMGRLPERSGVHLLLIGHGMDGEDLARAVAASPARDRIHVLGFRDDAPAVMAACDATVLPSLKREGLPKTVIESMAHGVPAVVTDTGGSAELVEDGVSGFVVPPGDAAALADRIAALAKDRHAAAEMGKAARARIRDHFHVNDSVEATRSMFRAWVGEKRGTPVTES
jgi:glycosyltransferase involved in cell wall biosynthesis